MKHGDFSKVIMQDPCLIVHIEKDDPVLLNGIIAYYKTNLVSVIMYSFIVLYN